LGAETQPSAWPGAAGGGRRAGERAYEGGEHADAGTKEDEIDAIPVVPGQVEAHGAEEARHGADEPGPVPEHEADDDDGEPHDESDDTPEGADSRSPRERGERADQRDEADDEL
jgi:hypothetical protein